MKMSKKISIKNSIAIRLLKVVLGIYFVIVVIVGVAQLYVAYQTNKSDIYHELKGMEDSLKGPLAVSIWNWDENTLRTSIRGIINVPMIEKVTVVNENGEIIANGISITDDNGIHKKVVQIKINGFSDQEKEKLNNKYYNSEQIKYVIPLTHIFDGEKEKVGHATLYISNQIIYKRMKTEAVMIGVVVGVSLFVFALALFWAVNSYLRKPLVILTDATAGISLDNLDEFSVDTKTGQDNEIKQLEETICSMVKDLHSAVYDKEKLQNQLVQSQKMDAFGQMAGGLAHNFNNMLGAIMGCAEMIGGEAADNPKIKELTAMIISASQRAGDLSNKLMAFARQQEKTWTVVDINEIINDTISILENTVDKLIIINSELNAEKTTVMGDPAQLQSVFLNMGLNACYAMPKGGKLTFKTSEITFDNKYCAKSTFDLIPGVYIHIEVLDTGVGIDSEIIDKIFDPFFTTKEQGKGTGLGLSASYGTIKQHKGEIKVNSEMDKGTCFHIYLPYSENKTSEKTEKEIPLTGTGCVLVVDDEEMIRTTLTAFLKDLGYKVISAKNGLEAVACYREHANEIDLVICDMIMPKMNGRDCFMEIKAINPDIRFIIASGFTQEEDILELKKHGLAGFIDKPFRKVQLSRIIAEVLNFQ